jgi:hypothetical protein
MTGWALPLSTSLPNRSKRIPVLNVCWPFIRRKNVTFELKKCRVKMLRTVPDDEMLSEKPFGCWNCAGTVGNPAAVITESLLAAANVRRMSLPRNSSGVVLLVRYDPT